MLKKLKSEGGFSLIEVLMALALLGIIASSFLMAIAIASQAILVADERTTAESLAKSQMEYIKQQPYNEADEDVNGDGYYYEAEYWEIDTSEYPSFNIGSVIEVNGVEEVVNKIVGFPWNSVDGAAEEEDNGLQKIKLIICNNGDDGVSLDEYVIILEDFKASREE